MGKSTKFLGKKGEIYTDNTASFLHWVSLILRSNVVTEVWRDIHTCPISWIQVCRTTWAQHCCNCGCLQNDKYYEVCSITYFRGFILHLIIWSLTWTVLTSFYFVFSYRKEKLFGKQTVQANVYVLEMGLCFAIQTHAKQMKFARCRMDSWGVIH